MGVLTKTYIIIIIFTLSPLHDLFLLYLYLYRIFIVNYLPQDAIYNHLYDMNMLHI